MPVKGGAGMSQQTVMLTTVVYAIAAGVFLIALARRLRVPAIVPLLLGGIALGPSGIDLIRPEELGGGLRTIVSCAVAIILFEGGLSLDLEGFRHAGKTIRRLLTVGAIVTWLATAGAVYLIFGFDPLFCLLAGSLVIVTGPTVIVPILRRIRLQENLHHILLWEGVMIDAVGVFIAVFCFELVTNQYSGDRAAAYLVWRFAVGTVVGLAVGFATAEVLRRRLIHEELTNLFALSAALLTFAICEQLAHESGLLSVVLAGFVLAIRAPHGVSGIKEFKAQLTDLLIGLLFILLAAKLNPKQFLAYGWELAAAAAAVILVVRPLNIFISALGCGLSTREKLALSWVAPRGIVAASMGSLFSLRLADEGIPQASFLEAFTYLVIFATVVIQGFSAGKVSRALGVRKRDPHGWLIVGANAFAVELALLVRRLTHLDCVIIDSNARAVRELPATVTAVRADALDPRTPVLLGDYSIGNVLALTDNEDLNTLICQAWSRSVGSSHVFRWAADARNKQRSEELPGIVPWDHMPKPSVVAHELEKGHAELLVYDTQVAVSKGEPYTLLAITGSNRFELPGMLSKTAGKTTPARPVRYVYLLREANRLARCLRPELIIRVAGTDFTTTIQKVMEAAADHVTEIDREASVREILDREKVFPTSLGHGFAAPHAYSRNLSQHVCVVVHTPDGIEMPTPDGDPVRFLFVVLSPTGDPQGHLMIMGQIAQVAADEAMLPALAEARTPYEAIELIDTRFQ